MSDRPNIVLFVADQMRADALGHLGNAASRTPNFDALIGEGGVSFENAYCQNPVCVPSRCSFLTGWYPHTKGHRTMHFLLEKDDPTVLQALKRAGYEVLWLGRDDLLPAGSDKSSYCDEYYSGLEASGPNSHRMEWMEARRGSGPEDPRYYSFFGGEVPAEDSPSGVDDNCVRRALEFLEGRKAQGGAPFLIYITLMFPHPPYACPEPWFGAIDRGKVGEPRPAPADWSGKASILKHIHDAQGIERLPKEGLRELRATYLAMVSKLDDSFGKIVAKLKEKGLYDSTDIIAFSDHGDYTGDYGIVEKNQNTFEDPIVNVPFIFKPDKGRAVRPRISKSLVELIDIPATIADLAEIKLEYTQFGKSLLPLLEKDAELHDAVFCEGGRIHGEPQAMESGHGPDSLYWPRLSGQASEGPEHTKAIMARMGDYKYIYRLYERDELYDLAKDPEEELNLAGMAEHEELGRRMRERILRFLVETGDYVPMKRDRRG